MAIPKTIPLTLLTLTLSALAGPALAATFPTEPVKFIVPYAPGGTTDLVARTVGKKVSEELGQPVIVQNKPGAGGNIGMAEVAQAKPDGYTVGMGAISTNAVNPHLYKEMKFDPTKDFTPIVMLGTSTIVLEVNPSVPVNNVQEFVAYAKQHPGLIYGAAGTGTSMHLAGVLFGQMTGTNLEHVAYKGSAPALTDMMGGQIQVMFDNLPASLPHIKAGKLKALAVAGAKRNPQLPDVPTIAEAGVQGYAVDPWFALYGPAGMSADAVSKLNQAFGEALASDEVKTVLENAGFSPEGSTSEALGQLSASEYQRWGEIVKAANLQM
ncbi:Bug family tripartite tricarboxylate transporter substrate binding protein [Allopusillimonas ginsengisoli]|uniref:Bug family tripartite tricarboxylate transporter substrate binding protein n=1 Tax=Allopusillimonas ginsengisoli TaxID=453575 RepID=UPI0010215379|nr:tripartite tricarboxylate transporter substrate binding protein [Allopusillimonas ginsengisoli]TEA74145.1 tripartite tricarboxylate transporter substrate binding protein [Allopusillimonas ginsengisoli]